MSDKSALTPFQALNLEQRRKAMFLRAAGIVGIISGVILVVSGYITHPILLMMLSFIDEHYASSMSAMELYFLKLAISILTSLTALGGIVVICSGVVLLLKNFDVVGWWSRDLWVAFHCWGSFLLLAFFPRLVSCRVLVRARALCRGDLAQ